MGQAHQWRHSSDDHRCGRAEWVSQAKTGGSVNRWVANHCGPLLYLCLGVYVVFQMAVGRFVQMDEVFFKAAGREWARSSHFAAPEIHGVPTADPPGFLRMAPPLSEIWFAQPPVYTFLFGVFARLFGFGPMQCIVFDGLIHAILAL